MAQSVIFIKISFRHLAEHVRSNLFNYFFALKYFLLFSFLFLFVTSSHSQKSVKVCITIDTFLINDNLIQLDSSCTVLENKSKKRIVFWGNETDKLSVVIYQKQHKQKEKIKIRIESGEGINWYKPKLRFFCDGLNCHLTRWDTWSWGTSTVISITPLSKIQTFHKSQNSVQFEGSCVVYYE